jgi:predicted ABC-type ATPase
MAIERTKQLIENRDSFAIETTMSGTVLSQTLGQAADAGYYIAIKLLRVETVDVSSKRVARRVQQGGHDIPMADQIRGGNEWTIYDAESQQPQILLSGRGGLDPE